MLRRRGAATQPVMRDLGVLPWEVVNRGEVV